jgi:hypothetical protein
MGGLFFATSEPGAQDETAVCSRPARRRSGSWRERVSIVVEDGRIKFQQVKFVMKEGVVYKKP